MLTRWLAFARGMLRRQSIAREVEEELAFHLEQETARHQALGLPAEEARRLAALHLGPLAVVRDDVADVRTTRLDVVWRELRVGVRVLTAAPSFTIPALVVLALGIGGTTMVWSVLDGVLLRPLPFTAPEELVRVWSRNDERRIPFLSVSPADFDDWRARVASLQIAAYERPQVVAPADELDEPITVMHVSPDLFPLLGVSAAMGRTFGYADALAHVALISHRLWQGRFGGTADVVGRPVLVGNEALDIIGVMPAGFDVPNAAADLWRPLDLNAAPSRFAHTLRVLGRTKGPADPGRVQRDLDIVADQLAQERPAQNEGWRVTVLPFFDTIVSPELRRSLWITAGAVLFVLVMATISVAGLVLARSASRERELAVRVALGASRGSLVRLLLLECLVLAAVAGGLGLAVAFWGVALLRDAGGATIPRLEEVGVDTRVFVGTAAASLASALLAGVVPAWRSTRSLHDRLRTRGLASDLGTGRTLPLLVVVEMSCAVLLVVGSALLVQTVSNLHSRPLGFDSHRLLSIATVWPQGLQPAHAVARVDAAIDRIARTPGVAVAAAGSSLPFAGGNSGNTFEIEGQDEAGRPRPDTDFRVVSPTYFNALGVPVLRGRAFDNADRARGVVVISHTAATRFWPGRDAVGSRLKLGPSDWLTVVGIVGDARYGALDDPQDTVRSMMYIPHWQMPLSPLTFVVRANVAPASLGETLRQTLSEGQGFGVRRLETMTAIVRQASAPQRFSMGLVTTFACSALVLAVVGLYGLLALIVGRRAKEFGVRFALGARPSHVVRMMVRRTLALAVAGVALGLLASFSLSGALRSVLFGVSPNDSRTYAAVGVGFVLLALGVSAIPIRRALLIDPVRLMQAE